MAKYSSNILLQGSVSRRSAMGLIGGAAVASGLVLPDMHVAAQAKRGGTLKVGLAVGNTSDMLDPTTPITTSAYFYYGTLGNNLVELAPDKTQLPSLAESWESSDRAKRWVFKIRQGVQFHNGKTLTADDVVYSITRHMGADSKSSAKPFLAGVKSVRADGNTVVVEHETGDADLPLTFSTPWFVIVPNGHSDWRNFVGTGPYILAAYEPGVRFRATRNPNYWRRDAAWYDAVEAVTIADSTARTNALVSGEVSVVDRLPPGVMDLVKRTNRFKVIEGIGRRYTSMAIDTRNAPFDNRHVRDAIKFGIDRKEIVDKIFRGYATIGNDHPIPVNDPVFNKDIPQRAYDPDKAKWHLKQAGMDTLSLKLSAADVAFAGAVDAAVLFQASAARVGINVDVVREPNDGYWSSVWKVKPVSMAFFTLRPAPSHIFGISYGCGAVWNDAFWCNERFETLSKEGRVETDLAKRKAIYGEMQQIVHNEGGGSVFAFPTNLDAYALNVRGNEPDAGGDLCGYRVAERTWFA